MRKIIPILSITMLLFAVYDVADAQIYLHGSVSGVLEDTVYFVDGHISAHDLIIEAGATFYFLGFCYFNISGFFQAVGTEEDSIKFLLAPGVSGWQGLSVSNVDSSRIEYCYITGSTTWGAISFSGDLTISHCVIEGNSGDGGIRCYNTNTSITNCTIIANTSDYSGAGIYVRDSDVTISDCIITNNFVYGLGGGIQISDSNVRVIDCVISGNSANVGAGIYCRGYDSLCTVTVTNCLFDGNIAGEDGGGLYFETSIPTIENCTISGNSAQAHGAGIWCRNTVPTIVNTIVEGSREGSGVLIQNSLEISLSYCDFYDNIEGNFHGDLPDSLGEIITTNANGDSCDIYQNIFLDPMFVDIANGDYHLMAGSPCIDAGDPESPLDPDSTIADMGAFYFHHTSGINSGVTQVQPSGYYLLPNYPNPFNSSTIISYTIPTANNVTLTVYNNLGRTVTALVRGWQQPGTHQVTFDGLQLASGVYFYRLETGIYSDVCKMILLK